MSMCLLLNTDGPGNLTKACSGTTRYMIPFLRNSQRCYMAWRAPNEQLALQLVMAYWEKQGYHCKPDPEPAREIAGSYKQ